MDLDTENVTPFDENKLFEYADRFIELANELSQLDNSGVVGAGLRYAATRYCAFEASLHTDNYAEDMENNIETFTNDFINMLRVNFEDYNKSLGGQVE